MKRFVPILFITFLVWNYIGYFSYFQFEKYTIKQTIKKKIKESLSDSELITFHFTKNEMESLSWFEAHEFEYKNEMYDVVSQKKMYNGDCIIKCISDSQETELFSNLNQMMENDMGDRGDMPFSNWKTTLDTPYFLQKHPEIILNLLWINDISAGQNYISNLLLGHIQKASQPPELFFFL